MLVAVLERVQDRPLRGAYDVEVGCLADLQVTGSDTVIAVSGDLVEPVPQWRHRLEGTVTGVALRVDRQPRLTIGAQHVLVVQVAVQQHDLVGLQVVGEELPLGRDLGDPLTGRVVCQYGTVGRAVPVHP